MAVKFTFKKHMKKNMTNKNFPSLQQSTEVALSRANTLMDMADKILAKYKRARVN